MLPEATNSQGDPSCHPNSLRGAIESTLQEARLHADQMERVRELGVEAVANKKAEREAGAALFKIYSRFSPELLKESGPRGDYLRALFHLLYMPVRAPRAQIIAPAGMGKTRELITALTELAGLTVYITVPNHSLVDQLVVDIEKTGLSQVYPIRGRAVDGMCAVPDIGELSSKFANAGLSVQKTLCSSPKEGEKPRCPHFYDCKYQAQRTAYFELEPPPDETLVFVMPHQYLTRWPWWARKTGFQVGKSKNLENLV